MALVQIGGHSQCWLHLLHLLVFMLLVMVV